ncbi:MAG: DUF2029 domain-containing protein [Flavobacteriales bacterium]|nr:DUF2029 domain-containing protein [Flavobacteriales bacterium]MCC6936608.1 DUF2029 domain-containing protein [Flavobacteriales bacterium]
MFLGWNRFPGRFTIVLVLLTLLLLVLEHVNGRFWLNDFRVYYGAAQSFLHGDTLYGVAHGLDSGTFKYAPIMAMAYVPLALLPYSVAATIQYVLIVAAFIWSVLLTDRLVRTHVLGGRAAGYGPVFLTTLVVVVHLHRELHLGNINVLLLWILLLGLDRILSGRSGTAGILIGLAILAKPHFVVLLPLLLLRDQRRACSMAVVTVILGLVLPAAFLGVEHTIQLHRDWFAVMAGHNASLIYTGGDAHNSVDTIYSFLHRTVLHHFTSPSTLEVAVILGCIALLFAAYVLRNRMIERNNAGMAGHIVIEYFLLLALVPSITLTDTNHFLFSLPAIMLLCHRLIPRPRSRWLLLVALLLLFAYGGNWADALGDLSDRMVHFGVLGIANIGLVLLVALHFFTRGSNQKERTAST